MLRSGVILSLLVVALAAATPGNTASQLCPLTTPVRSTPTDRPADGAVSGWLYANSDRTIWAGWDAVRMRAGADGNKVLWFRPKGSTLTVSARRLDGDSAAATIDLPCCYGGRMQAGGIAFPTDGCWKITAKAGDSELEFVTLVQPASPTSAATPLDYLPALKGDYFRHESKSVGRPFHIYVAFPESYAAQPQARYPVVFLLDGDSTFPILATYHLFLNYDEGVPQAIVVGIAYGSFDPATNKRDYDFSAPAADATKEQGGAPAFQAFLKQELIPEIDRRYRTDPARRVLFGQSRGGYMILYSAFTDPDLFWGRIASNPSFDPGRELFFSKPATATRNDLGLVVVSGSRNPTTGRKNALEWFASWEGRPDTSWQVKTVTLDGGTHAADITNGYRTGMVWLFGRDGKGQQSPSADH